MNKIATAVNLMKEQKYEEAANLFHSYIEENPKDPLGFVNFGNLLLHMNDLDHAKNFFEKAISLDEKAATAYYGLGNVYYEQENFVLAHKNFLEAIKHGLEEADVYFMLGMAHQNQQQFKLALPYLLRAKELSPDDHEILFQYGLALAQSELLSEAKEVFETVLSIDKQHSDAWYNLGVVALLQDDATQAIAHFNHALHYEPNHVLAANGKQVAEQSLTDTK
ncbi:tetratricopeptide repeat protein [Ornithinibacillus contaminans]|uniref:tetratricopeptide repeat protein n=1 Tax=Ornithinibacillus contaminans TaxID=694055 RepID=UPI00064DC59C|nr:tetratricopeptide repeat protein [Ornithinibacillus contaminans]